VYCYKPWRKSGWTAVQSGLGPFVCNVRCNVDCNRPWIIVGVARGTKPEWLGLAGLLCRCRLRLCSGFICFRLGANRSLDSCSDRGPIAVSTTYANGKPTTAMTIKDTSKPRLGDFPGGSCGGERPTTAARRANPQEEVRWRAMKPTLSSGTCCWSRWGRCRRRRRKGLPHQNHRVPENILWWGRWRRRW
jgi:hypothetical protein